MNNRSTIQNQPCRNGFTYFILDMHKRKTYQTELFSTWCNEKNKNLSDLYSLRILIDDPGIRAWRARWYATIRSEPRIRSGLLARRGEGGSVPTNRRKLVAGIYDVSARYGCYAFHPWFVFGVMLKSRFGLDPWMLLHLNEQYISPDSLVFQIFFKFQRDLEYRRKSYFLLEYSWIV